MITTIGVVNVRHNTPIPATPPQEQISKPGGS